jgi:hypothetical protein
MKRDVTEPTLDKWEHEVHPAFGLIGASRVSNSPPGSVLFDSDIRHQHSVVVRVSTATRKRDLSHDWIHQDKEFLEVEMSEAQWASFVSSMNVGSGVPCTIRRREDDVFVDAPPYQPRLQESMREVHGAADKTFSQIKEALAAYEAHKTAANLRTLHYTIENATANVDYTARRMGEHAENVVQRARADIEAFVVNKAQQLGLTAAEVGQPFALEAGEGS